LITARARKFSEDLQHWVAEQTAETKSLISSNIAKLNKRTSELTELEKLLADEREEYVQHSYLILHVALDMLVREWKSIDMVQADVETWQFHEGRKVSEAQLKATYERKLAEAKDLLSPMEDSLRTKFGSLK
jgi:hypothetical protein